MPDIRFQGGAACPSVYEIGLCNADSCGSNNGTSCVLGEWVEWTPCSASCGVYVP